MRLLPWFSKAQQKPVPKDTTPARQGHIFQTCFFVKPMLPMLGKFHLVAQKEDDGQPGQNWTVYRVSVRPDTLDRNKGEIIVEQEKIKTDATFVEALTCLANFESTAPDMQYEAADPAEKEALGFQHYQAFGHREGYVFDKVTGAPVSVKNGGIAGAGVFAKTEIERFGRHSAVRQSELAVKLDNEAVMRAAMPGLDFAAKDSDPLQAQSVADLNMKRIVFHRFVGVLEKQKRRMLECRQDYLKEEYTFFEKLYRHLWESIGALEKIDFFDRAVLRRGVDVFDLFAYLEADQFCMNNYEYSRHVASYRDTQQIISNALNLPANFCEDAVLQPPDFHSKTLPQPVEDFIAYCHGVEQVLNDICEAAKKGEKATLPLSLPESPARRLLASPAPAPL